MKHAADARFGCYSMHLQDQGPDARRDHFLRWQPPTRARCSLLCFVINPLATESAPSNALQTNQPSPATVTVLSKNQQPASTSAGQCCLQQAAASFSSSSRRHTTTGLATPSTCRCCGSFCLVGLFGSQNASRAAAAVARARTKKLALL